MSHALVQAVAWLEQGNEVVLVTVTEVAGSTPRPVGPAMAVHADGRAAGSVSVGCVDGETHALALEALRTGEPVRRTYGPPAAHPTPSGPTTPSASATPTGSAAPLVADALPADLLDLRPTLLCGGALTVEVEPLGPADLPRLRAALTAADADRPLLLVYGAGDVAVDLARLGRVLGRRVVVCDHRPVFGHAERFPDADEVVVDRPHRHLSRLVAAGMVDARTAVVVLAHDAAVEDPVLTVAVGSAAGYVGALGSRGTHRARVARLSAQGLAPEALDRLRGPVGLDLGGVTSAETALSVLAEVVACEHGGSGRPLALLDGPVHGRS